MLPSSGMLQHIPLHYIKDTDSKHKQAIDMHAEEHVHTLKKGEP
jgi:hypothetical protein